MLLAGCSSLKKTIDRINRSASASADLESFKLIVAKGGVPLAHIDRFMLTNNLPGGNSGWNVYLTSGSTHFQSLVLGDQLGMITLNGPRALSK